MREKVNELNKQKVKSEESKVQAEQVLNDKDNQIKVNGLLAFVTSWPQFYFYLEIQTLLTAFIAIVSFVTFQVLFDDTFVICVLIFHGLSCSILAWHLSIKKENNDFYLFLLY